MTLALRLDSDWTFGQALAFQQNVNTTTFLPFQKETKIHQAFPKSRPARGTKTPHPPATKRPGFQAGSKLPARCEAHKGNPTKAAASQAPAPDFFSSDWRSNKILRRSGGYKLAGQIGTTNNHWWLVGRILTALEVNFAGLNPHDVTWFCGWIKTHKNCWKGEMDIKSTSCLGVRGADEIRKIGHGRPQTLEF